MIELISLGSSQDGVKLDYYGRIIPGGVMVTTIGTQTKVPFGQMIDTAFFPGYTIESGELVQLAPVTAEM